MSEHHRYSAKSVYEGLTKTFHQYLRAQYHIWDESLIAERERLFERPGITHQAPYLEATPIYLGGTPYRDMGIPDVAKQILELAANVKPATGIPLTPYHHQAEAIEAFLRDRADLIVATGTGSGKTESFLMPVLGSLAIESRERAESWSRPGVRALLLYPMNALVNDQVSRLRRLLGNPAIAKSLRGNRARNSTFGMYTGRTPYPGQATKAKNKKRIGDALSALYIDGITPEISALLQKEGKWPAKDVAGFISNDYTSASDDSELLTRQEMQARSPDILVTNYSMLEYMMLRPIEASIFEQTRLWLAQDEKNCFTIVLDEAHIYRGSAGAEVAFLLRRLHSRLGIPRERVRYILTSASLGAGADAEAQIIQFAGKLTGDDEARRFKLVAGKLEQRPQGQPATEGEQLALSEFDFETLHTASKNLLGAKEQVAKLAEKLGSRLPGIGDSVKDLQAAAYSMLLQLPAANLLATEMTSSPKAIAELQKIGFTSAIGSEHALEAILALMAFAKEPQTERSFASIRAHLFYRGLGGLYVCTNSACGHAHGGYDSSLGQMRASPAFECECGARVYELLTHRDCGAAYIRGFIVNPDRNFLWHEPSTRTWSDMELIEAHLYVMPSTGQMPTGTLKWLHTPTGRLLDSKPTEALQGEFLLVAMPTRTVIEQGRQVLTIEPECPACKKELINDPKIMDLATKGEAPFAHLIRSQVALQPALTDATPRSPNKGRKSLLFSDGRQKAARLARDIPREIELDVFRQMLLLAATKLDEVEAEPLLNRRMYASFLTAVQENGLLMFDGGDRSILAAHVTELQEIYGGNLVEALDAFEPPPAYTALLLKQLCSTFYSISSLTLGYVRPSTIAMRSLKMALPTLDEVEILALSIPWLQRILSKFAFDRTIPSGVRRQAWPYPSNGCRPRDGYLPRQRDFLTKEGYDVEKLTAALSTATCDPVTDDGIYVLPQKVQLQVAIHSRWTQCENCRNVLPTQWNGVCVNCLSANVTEVSPGETSYLRARKGFWRDPVVAVIERKERPVNLAVEEHTAQLSHKDVDNPTTTTELFERRFRDILVSPRDVSIDVLSSTTTMEVGIDIGSLVAVGMRNVPPMRQNYQQRAGRAGRRGTSISTVITFAQNGAHDAFYFSQPDKIIGGDPPKPILDTGNAHIIVRHIHAQLVQDFFGPRAGIGATGDIFSVLGGTWAFYTTGGPTSLGVFRKWIEEAPEARSSLQRARNWLPPAVNIDPEDIAAKFIAKLESFRPLQEEGIETGLIDYMFNKGLLPSYAFPRDLCALQIERLDRGVRTSVVVDEKPQQGLNIALSEYAPGKQVIVNKKTYRIGTIAANVPSIQVNRAEPLFESSKRYIHCTRCLFTAGFVSDDPGQTNCPQCNSESLTYVTVVTPEIVFPRGRKEIDEYDDEQTYSRATSAQLPLPDASRPLTTRPFGSNGEIAFERAQTLVMVNRGPRTRDDSDGFLVCDRCGKVLLDEEAEGAHERDYWVQPVKGRPGQPSKCNGAFRKVYLGYSFLSDVLVLRFKLSKPLRFDLLNTRKRRPMEDALTSLADALVLAMARVLDIDAREVSAGFRFASHAGETFADIFIYDTLAGGAGYAYQAGEVFDQIFREAESLLRACTCDTSCESCLRHFANRFNHGVLDRRLALDVAEYIRTGKIAVEVDAQGRKKALRSFEKLLELAGWSISPNDVGTFSAVHGTKTIRVDLCPSLIDCPVVKQCGQERHFTFTPYELQRDLSSAYAEVA